MMIGRLSQKEFVRKENIDSKWKKYSRDPKKFTMPEGADWHPENPYNNYNAVWINPDTDSMIDKFIVKEGKYFKYDKANRPKGVPDYHEVLRAVINDLRNGFVFDDYDRWKTPSVEFSYLDTCTHMLGGFSKNKPDRLVYTKCLSRNPKSTDSNRLVYEVFKPQRINGVWICEVILNNFMEHRYDNKDYTTLGKSWANERRFSEEDLYDLFF